MTLVTRRYLYLFFILAFFIITPIVILYANGYELSLSQGRLVKTGMFILNTKPTGAKIFIDNKQQQVFLNKIFKKENFITTPAKIKNIIPGEYTVKFEMEGYWPWEKKLNIYPGQSTYAEDVMLFKHKTPLKLIEGSTKELYPSNDGKYLISSNNSINVLNQSNDQYSPLNIKAKNIEWSPYSDKFLADHKIFDTSDLSLIVDLDKISSSSISNIKWDKSDDNNIYFFKNKTLYRYDLNNKQINELLTISNDIIDYFIKGNNAYFIDKNQVSTTLTIYDINGKKQLRAINFPVFSQLKFINYQSKPLNLFDASNKILYLIDPMNVQPIIGTIKNVNNAKWINENTLLFFNNSEIYTFDLNSRNSNLLTRISEPIKDVFWHPSNNYIIYVTDKKINSFELDQRDKHNSIELMKIENIYSSYMSSMGSSIYFSGKIGSQEGIYKLSIQ